MKTAAVSARDIVHTALLSAILLVAQVTLASLPNIELVSVLVLLYTLQFGRRALYAIYIFVLLEGLIYGFGLWWASYLYVWGVLFIIAYVFRRIDSLLFWAFINGAFGLCFGALTSLPYFVVGGAEAGASYFLAGIPFDIAHCAGNFISVLILYVPLRGLMKKLAGFFSQSPGFTKKGLLHETARTNK